MKPNQPTTLRNRRPSQAPAAKRVVSIHHKSQAQLRIIGGHWRGRKLNIATVEGLRPTTDRVRETVFNWLAPHLSGARVLDLFAGTGALGLEALSRDADYVDMVELSALASQQLSDNLAQLTLMEHQQAHIHHMSCFDWLRSRSLKDNNEIGAYSLPYDVVFIDPPFALDIVEDVLDKLVTGQVINEKGCIYVEQPRPLVDLTLPSGWDLHRHKNAGQVHFGLLKKA